MDLEYRHDMWMALNLIHFQSGISRLPSCQGGAFQHLPATVTSHTSQSAKNLQAAIHCILSSKGSCVLAQRVSAYQFVGAPAGPVVTAHSRTNSDITTEAN